MFLPERGGRNRMKEARQEASGNFALESWFPIVPKFSRGGFQGWLAQAKL